MRKKYTVRLSEDEQKTCAETVRKLSGGSEKARRARILLKADAGGPGWTDRQITEAFSCRRQTVEKIRRRCVLEGFAAALERKQRAAPPVAKLLDGEGAARLIALRLGAPPAGRGAWSLRLLARRAVELEIVEAISHETVRRTLKKTASRGARSRTG